MFAGCELSGVRAAVQTASEMIEASAARRVGRERIVEVEDEVVADVRVLHVEQRAVADHPLIGRHL